MTVATVHIKEYYGTSAPNNPPDQTSGNEQDNVSNLNLVSVLGTEQSSSANPVTAGNRSFSKWVVYELHAKNDSNKIDNFQGWMTPAATTTGVTYETNLNTDLALTTSVYPSPGGPSAVDFETASEGDVESPASLYPTSDPGVENIGVTEGSAGLSTNSTHSDFIAIQLVTTGSTPPGNLPQKTFHFQYDEQ
jgi:hypothetical protein